MMNLPTLVIATTNPGKLREVAQMLKHLPLTLRSLAEFEDIVTVEETGRTYADNAQLKARGYARQISFHVIADDSGLEVDALEGAPGVRSARYSGESASDQDRVSHLLVNLAGVPEPKRTARFVSAIAVAESDGRIIHTASGICEGMITLQPRGSGGFGYDPIFVPSGYDKTLAELSPAVKNRISHRAQALLATRAFLLSCQIDDANSSSQMDAS
ncbi:MAG: XTP/dITP diphosphohydrolase [Blastocatellia bacterium]|jgi:XTP/dITP diphosphohydrolase|nr:XTP/dITP diphosphohydrolase [Blastocatellia bacterium]